jgi:hypothetical protein
LRKAGSLALADCQHRIRKLNVGIDVLIAEEQTLEAELRQGRSESPSATEMAEWAAALPELLTAWLALRNTERRASGNS